MTLATSAKTVLYERYVPVIPDEFKIYDSYAVDPRWQIRFTIIWTSVLALSTLLSAPYTYRSLRRGAYFKTLAVNEAPAETLSGNLSKSSPSDQHKMRGGLLARTGLLASALYQSIALRSVAIPRAGKGPRRYFNLGTGQCAIIAVYLAVSIVCFTVGAELLQNSNRPGFVALSQLPLIVLLSLKSPLPLPIFLPTLSYEHYNFLHRYAGRTLFLLVTVHGAMWINQFRTTNQMDQVWSEKSKRGMIAYGLMCGVVLTSLKPVRRMCYQVFWLSHLVLFTGFFAAISYHTPYAAKWVYPCVAIYGYDFTVRMLRYRVKDAIIVPVDGTTTLIHIPDCGSGWKPTQHIFLRVLRGPGIFESHPFTITNAPALPGASASPRGITLYAKATGDWTKRLHALANDVAALEIGEDVYEREAFLKLEKDGQVDVADHPGKRVAVILDGPYGGLKIDVGDYGRVLCLAGGSGITFALGVIEAAICARVGGVIRNVEVVWAVREASLVQALGPTLVYLHRTACAAGLVLNILIHISGDSDTFKSDFTALLGQLPQAATIHLGRPDVSAIVKTAAGDAKSPRGDEQNASDASGAGLAVVSCGPENLVAATREAVGALSIREKMAAGGVAFSGETYSL